MTTLIEVRTSRGLVGRCDAKCYEAHETECDCICHGRNHGAGLRQAIENTREWAEAWLQDYAEQKHLGSDWRGLVGLEVNQLGLFDREAMP